MTLEEYIQQIEENDIKLTEINLGDQSLEDEDIERLMHALKENPAAAARIVTIDLTGNNLTKITIPSGLYSLKRLRLDSNHLRSFYLTVPLPALTNLSVCYNEELTCVNLPEGLQSLEYLYLTYNKLSALDLPRDANRLKKIVLGPTKGVLERLNIPEEYVDLEELHIMGTQLTEFVVPETLTNLKLLRVSHSLLNKITIPPQCKKLGFLSLEQNQLEELAVPVELSNLYTLDISRNKFKSISIPEGLAELKNLDVCGNLLTIQALLRLYDLSRAKQINTIGLEFRDFDKQRSRQILIYLGTKDIPRLRQCFNIWKKENEGNLYLTKMATFEQWLGLLEMQGVNAKNHLGYTESAQEDDPTLPENQEPQAEVAKKETCRRRLVF